MKEARLSPAAKVDLADIWNYFAQGSDARADAFLGKILGQCNQLAQFPRMGMARDKLASNLRSFPIKKYLIFFRPIDDTVEIVRILYGGRDIEAIFRDDPPDDPDVDES